jgi:hypothetical protein
MDLDMSLPPPSWQLAVGTVVAVAAYALLAPKKKGPKRRLSFTSQIMAAGSWPSGFDMAEPIINAVLTFPKAPKLDDVRVLIRRLMAYDRMGGSISKDSSGAWGFDKRSAPPTDAEVAKHLTVVEVDGTAALWAKAHEICMQGLQGPDKATDPWWEFVLLQNSKGRNGGGAGERGESAVVVRVHHIIGDGIALVGLVRAMMTTTDGKPIPDYFAAAATKARKESKPGSGLAAQAAHVLKVASAAATCLTLGMTPYDSDLAFTAPNKKTLQYTKKRRTVLLPDVGLSFIKKLKDAATARSGGQRTTVNDVLFAASTGAIRRYCQGRNDPLLPAEDKEGLDSATKLQMRALLPVSFPRKADITDPARALRNLWCFVSCSMPIGSGGVLGRIAAARDATAAVKPPASFVAPVQLWIQNKLLPHLPLFLSRQTCYDTFTRHSCIFTNVPGPPSRILWAGAEVTGMQMVFPNLISQVSFISYGETVFGNCVVDDDVVTEPEALRALYVKELQDVAAALGVPFEKAVAQREAELKGLGL